MDPAPIAVGGLTTQLGTSDTAEHQHVSRAAGVHLRYHRSEGGEKVTAALRAGLFRVGGAYDPLSTPTLLRGQVTLRAA
jgi:tripartite-type tricarboxylate transporter receptor subunit TctC